MPRKFKPGEWVKRKGKITAPKMVVLKYVLKKDPFLGSLINDRYLECVWYENGERQSEVFHQNNLIKMIDVGGLFKT
ncbi:hypothetical protein GH721_04610 [Kriegella sp. EG-1]|nr:hypothetical protein [Flavobacteriaceae bacterium EG-1]